MVRVARNDIEQNVIASRAVARQSRAAALLLLTGLTGCAFRSKATPPPAASAAHQYVCLLPSEQRVLVAELFFSRSIRGRLPLSDAEWADFAAQVVTPNFPAGFTVFDAAGQWQNPATQQIGREQTKVLLIAVKRSPDLSGRLQAVIDAYKARFRQESVGVITRDGCGSFN